MKPVHPDGVRVRRVALADVSEVEFRTSWLRTHLVLRPHRLEAFDGVASGPALKLAVARRDRTLASQWATALSLALLDRET